MDTEQFTELIKETLSSVFRRGSRYQTEKLGVVFIYVAVVIGSLIWGFSGTKFENELGADFGAENIEGIDKQVFFLENQSSDEWTNVRVIINQRFLKRLPKVEGNKRVTLGPSNFDYFYYIPRAWGRRSWETLAKETKRPMKAPSGLKLKRVQLRAAQGKLDLNMDSSGKSKRPKKN